MSLKNLRIGARLGLEFGLILALALGLGAYLLSRLNAMNEDWLAYQRVTAARAASAGAGVKALSDAIHHFKNFVLRGGDYATKFEADLSGLERTVEEYRTPGPLSGEEEARLQAITAGVASYRSAMATLVDLRSKGAGPTELDRAVAGADKPIAIALEELLGLSRKETARVSARLADRLALAARTGLMLMVAMALLGVAVTVLGTRALTRPLGRAVALAQQVAQGDLTAEVSVSSGDEVGQLLQALKDMTVSLAVTVRGVRQGAQAVSVASREIAEGNQELSTRTSQQAAGLEETASSMEELTATVKQNDLSARTASEQARAAAQVAGRGEAVAKQARASMSGIIESSKQIAELIAVIDGVAFQTNILALNAAVEAARAGDHGRGFAVVATEVRSLSQRTASSAKEVKAMVAESSRRVGEGARLVDDAGAAMAEVQAAIAGVAELIGQISTASAEQTQGIEQVNQAVIQMEQATQQNAAMVETAAANAEQLDALASRLEHGMSVFRVSAGGEPHEADRPELAPEPAEGGVAPVAA